MYRLLRLILIYDGTTQGNTDRNAFKTVLDTALASNLVYPDVFVTETTIFHSHCTLTNNTIHSELYYDISNLGTTNRDTLWDSVMTEKNKSTVTTMNLTKCDFVPGSNEFLNSQFESKMA